MSLINEALKRASQVHKAQPPPQAESALLQPAEHHKRFDPSAWLLPLAVMLLCVAGGALLWSGLQRSPSEPIQTASIKNSEAATLPPKSIASPPSLSLPEKTIPTEPVRTPVQSSVPTASSSVSSKGANPPAKPASSPPPNPVAAPPQITPEVLVQPPAPDPLEGPAKRASTPLNSTRLPPQLEGGLPPSATAASRPNPPSASPSAQPPTPNPAAATPVPAQATVVSSTPPASPAKPVEKTDAPSVQFPELKLQGIYYRLSSPTVLINGQTLTAGDSIQGVRVVKIERESVTLEMAGQKKVLILR